jgi:hypothetical protein
MFVRHEQVALRNCLARNILRPLNRDTLFEIVVLFSTIEAIENTGWEQEEIRLIGYGRGALATFRRGTQFLRLYYQGIPERMARNSLYASLLRKHGIGISLRRPDILLETAGVSSTYRLIEVKRSADRQYLADAIYKVFGYLKDYDAEFGLSPNPQGILVVWEGVSSSDPEAEAEAFAVLTFPRYQTYMQALQA